MSVGFGFDIHRLVKGRALILGGVKITHPKGLKGHSDADVVLHALMDALLGAAGLGDIGDHFPDSSARFKGADSQKLLAVVLRKVSAAGFSIENVDVTILAEQPKLKSSKTKIRKSMAKALRLTLSRVNVKASTMERLGSIGKGQAIGAYAVASLQKGKRK